MNSSQVGKRRRLAPPPSEEAKLQEDNVQHLQKILGNDIPRDRIIQLLENTNENIAEALEIYFSEPAPPFMTEVTSKSPQSVRHFTESTTKKEQEEEEGEEDADIKDLHSPCTWPRRLGDTMIAVLSTARTDWHRLQARGALQLQVEKADPGRISMRVILKEKAINDPSRRYHIRQIGRILHETSRWMYPFWALGQIYFRISLVDSSKGPGLPVETGDTLYLNLTIYVTASFFTAPANRDLSIRHAMGQLLSECGVRPVMRGSAVSESPIWSAFSSEVDPNALLDASAHSEEGKGGRRRGRDGRGQGGYEEVSPLESLNDTASNALGPEGGEVSKVTHEIISHAYDYSDVWSNKLDETPEPPGLSVTLRPYQRRALTWLLQRERLEGQGSGVGKGPWDQRVLPSLWEAYPLPEGPPCRCRGIRGCLVHQPLTLFYANPFTGQTDVIFPTEHNIIHGGILADGMFMHDVWKGKLER